MSALKIPSRHLRVIRAIDGWRRLTKKQRAGLIEYLIDDTKEQRESEEGGDQDWIETNVVALELLRAVAGWKP